MTKLIANCETGEVIERELTAEELAQQEADEIQYQAAKAAREQALAEAQAKRQALLDKLGITEEEARLLLGGN